MTISKTRIINTKKDFFLYKDEKGNFADNKAERDEINENNFNDFEFHTFRQGKSIASQINKEAVPGDYSLFYVKIEENEYYNCTDKETIEENHLCDLMINSKYKLEWYNGYKEEPCDPENIYFLTLEDAIAEAMTQSI